MFDVVVERVAIADALKGKSSGRWNELGQVCVGQTNLPLICLARNEPNAFAANSGTVIKERPL
jgi:hypothetical protein